MQLLREFGLRGLIPALTGQVYPSLLTAEDWQHRHIWDKLEHI